MIARVPPQNIEAEKAVLGAIMTKPDAIGDVSKILKSDDFYRKQHQIVYETIMDLVTANEPTDLITIMESLRKNKRLDDVGGVVYVTALANSVITAANAVKHANMVKDAAKLRRLIEAADQVSSMAYENSDEVPAIMDKAQRMILTAVADDASSGGFVPIKDVIWEVVDRLDKLSETGGGLTGIASGFRDLDRMTAGFQKSDLILVAARPSMGKTAFTLNMASYMVRHGQTVAFFSLEMGKEQLALRIMSSEGNIDSQRLNTGQITEDEWNKFMETCSKLSPRPIYIDDTPGISVVELQSKARRLKAERGLDIIMIDYLQLMQGRTTSLGDNRQQEISEISRSLKALARELNVPVIALSQLSRGVESRQIKRPMLSDLRESGSLEQDADIVMFLYREDYYDQDTENKNTEVIVAKHRNGPIGTVQLYFQKEYTKFQNIAENREEP